MTTETITLSKDPTIEFFMQKLAMKKARYEVFVDWKFTFAITPERMKKTKKEAQVFAKNSTFFDDLAYEPDLYEEYR